MNVTLLIDSIVRQTTILLAELATASGMRAPLAHTANQVFLDLVKELKQQGICCREAGAWLRSLWACTRAEPRSSSSRKMFG
jgi:hypothetical protein